MSDAREIETERLTLALPALGDFDDFATMRADPVVTRYTTRLPATRSDSWERLIRYRGFWDILGFGFWIVRERQSGRFVGTVGFGENIRGIEPTLDGFPEAGWVLASWCHGQGYGQEAVAAACSWLDREKGHKRSVCIIDPQNRASLGVAARHGFSLFARSTYLGEPILIFERLKPG
ncbi:GNAT family N-acetyltransferase [Asaia sp. BMEF1]|uniref:GNAT family N-acetyltransferase n=1 Tax=Asaia sp. BMEF1 TaxID=3155932 RepID=UPI003F67D614